MIGMGGGSTSWYLHKALPKAKVVAVELDPEIIRLSRKYYGFKENGKQSDNFIISELDGRMHILRKKTKTRHHLCRCVQRTIRSFSSHDKRVF